MLLISRTRMERHSAQAELFINSELCGLVELKGVDTSWSFGEFTPNDAFSAFAQFFGHWSMLMHEDTDRKLHEAMSDELRRAEVEIDRLDVRLHFLTNDEWQRAAQVNIDGTMIEWKQY